MCSSSRRAPSWSRATATCASAWVSTPTVIRWPVSGCGMLVMAVSSVVIGGGGHRRTGGWTGLRRCLLARLRSGHCPPGRRARRHPRARADRSTRRHQWPVVTRVRPGSGWRKRIIAVVPGGDPGSDVGFQCLYGFVGTTADHLVGEESEPPFHLVYPRRAGRGEMHVETRVLVKPRLDRGGLVGAVVVADEVDIQPGRHRSVDAGEELLELRRPVAAVQGADDGAVGDVER